VTGRGPIVLELERIRSFVIVAARGSYARAAPELFVSVSGLSRRIHDLEKDVGVELLERSMHGVVLTPGGEQLLEHANRVLAACDDFFDCALKQATSRHTARRTLQIGIAPGIQACLRNQVLAAVREAETGAVGRLYPDSDTRLIRKLIVGDLDLAILHQEPMAAHVKSVHIMSQQTMVCLASSLPQSVTEPLTLADLAPLPFVTSSELNSGTPVYYARLRSLFEEAGINRFVDVGSFDIDAVLQHLVSEAGFAIAHEPCHGDGDSLVVRPVTDLDAPLHTWLAWTVKAARDPVIKHTIETVSAAAGVKKGTADAAP
jgi:LysR family hca operon transcriptional activator